MASSPLPPKCSFNGNLTRAPTSVAQQAFITGSKVHKSLIWYIHITGLNGAHISHLVKSNTAPLRKQVQGDHFDPYLWNLKQRFGRQNYTKSLKAILSRDFEKTNLNGNPDLHYVFRVPIQCRRTQASVKTMVLVPNSISTVSHKTVRVLLLATDKTVCVPKSLISTTVVPT